MGPEDSPAPTEYPAAWGYGKTPHDLVGLALDSVVASMTDDEFSALVERTRRGAR
jgi:hypothetical protein